MAQLDRAPDYESGCRRFESSWAHHKKQEVSQLRLTPTKRKHVYSVLKKMIPEMLQKVTVALLGSLPMEILL
jgi:ABC-type phosphate/phosphonate transport system substrate-binding protein